MAIATNQQGIAKGLYTLSDVILMHTKLLNSIEIPIEKFPIFCCPHLENSCDCRKPKPGLLYQAMKYFKVENNQTVFIGDQEIDYIAAKNAQIEFIHLDRNNQSNQKFNTNRRLHQLSLDILIS